MRRRKINNDDNSTVDDDSTGSPKRKPTKSAQLDSIFTALILLSIVLSGFAIATFNSKLVVGLIESAAFNTRGHVVVIDAGSTGSRVLAFTFKKVNVILTHPVLVHPVVIVQGVSTLHYICYMKSLNTLYVHSRA